jgi:two-component system phosphate regulon sensor histidine kinase PhoR
MDVAPWLLLAAVALAVLGLGLLARRDLGRLHAALDRVEAGRPEKGSEKGPEEGPEEGGEPVLPPLARLAQRIGRIARARTRRAQEMAAALRVSEAIIERLPDPLIALDGERAAGRANAAARAAFGEDIAAVLRHPELRAAIDGAWLAGEPRAADLTLAVPVARDVRATVLPFAAGLPDGTRALVVLSDRTRERALERMRADFVANASHELRTPLASLMGFVETLRGPAADDPPAQARFLGIMAEQAARMERLIDDLLSLSRIELNEHMPPEERVDLGAVVARVLAGFEPRLAARGQRLVAQIEAGLGPVVADGDQMAQVLANLVDNALKYGREGGTATVGLRAGEGGLVLSVGDDGPGIARAHLPRLTERFYRVDKGRSRTAGGTGLGLAIVKHIVNRHRGRLAIESEEGRGTTASVWLPLAPPLSGERS